MIRNLIADCRAGVANLNDLDNALTDVEMELHLPITAPAPAVRLVKLEHAYVRPAGPLSIAACGHLHNTDGGWGDDAAAYEVEPCRDCVAVVKLEVEGTSGA